MKNKSIKTILGAGLVTLSLGLNMLLLTNNNEELPQVTSAVDDQILENENVVVSYIDLGNGSYDLIITDKKPGSFLLVPVNSVDDLNASLKIGNIQMLEEK